MKNIKVKVYLSNGKNMILSLEKWKAIIETDEQLVKITEETGDWTGRVLNKAHVVGSEIDKELTLESMRSEVRAKEPVEPEATPEQKAKIREMLAETREKFITNKFNNS